MTEPETAVPPSGHRWWLWLGLALIAFAVALSTIALWPSPTLKAIEAVGGSLSYDHPNPRMAAFMHKVLRQDPFRNLHMGPHRQSISHFSRVYNEKLRDEHLLQLDMTQLGKLSTLDISGPLVTDVGFSHVGRSPNQITMLICRKSRITDAGIEVLSKKRDLYYLLVPGNDITDRGLKSISTLLQLSYLNLGDTLITDTGLQNLISQLPNLRYLDIRNTDVTDNSLLCLAGARLTIILDTTQASDFGIKSLNPANINGIGLSSLSPRKLSRVKQRPFPAVPLDDQVIARLTRLTSVETVSLYGNSPREVAPLTPAAVNSLKQMPVLKGLYLFGIELPNDVRQDIRRQMPNLQVLSLPQE